MIRLFINQRNNNLFFNVLDENNIKVYYNSIGLEVDGSKSLSSSLINILIYKLLKFTVLHIKLDGLNYFFFKDNIFRFFLLKEKKFLRNDLFKNKKSYINYLKNNKFLAKKLYIFIYLDILNNYEFFLNSLLENINKFNFKFDKIFFLNKFSHGNYKFKKSYY